MLTNTYVTYAAQWSHSHSITHGQQKYGCSALYTTATMLAVETTTHKIYIIIWHISHRACYQ